MWFSLIQQPKYNEKYSNRMLKSLINGLKLNYKQAILADNVLFI
jgi:hypothetical protein